VLIAASSSKIEATPEFEAQVFKFGRGLFAFIAGIAGRMDMAG